MDTFNPFVWNDFEVLDATFWWLLSLVRCGSAFAKQRRTAPSLSDPYTVADRGPDCPIIQLDSPLDAKVK
jgi:hypothetical protein